MHIFDDILTSGKHMVCDFPISVEEMLEDDVNGLLYGVIFVIAQDSGVIHANSCDYFCRREAST